MKAIRYLENIIIVMLVKISYNVLVPNMDTPNVFKSNKFDPHMALHTIHVRGEKQLIR